MRTKLVHVVIDGSSLSITIVSTDLTKVPIIAHLFK
jgi:hypothetical protein